MRRSSGPLCLDGVVIASRAQRGVAIHESLGALRSLDCFVASLLAMTIPCGGLAAHPGDLKPQFSDQSLRHGCEPRIGPIVSGPRRDQGAGISVARR
jgi:hypothetical protein